MLPWWRDHPDLRHAKVPGYAKGRTVLPRARNPGAKDRAGTEGTVGGRVAQRGRSGGWDGTTHRPRGPAVPRERLEVRCADRRADRGDAARGPAALAHADRAKRWRGNRGALPG